MNNTAPHYEVWTKSPELIDSTKSLLKHSKGRGTRAAPRRRRPARHCYQPYLPFWQSAYPSR